MVCGSKALLSLKVESGPAPFEDVFDSNRRLISFTDTGAKAFKVVAGAF